MLSSKEEKELFKLEKKEEKYFLFFSFFIIIISITISLAVYYFCNTTLSIISETKGVVVPSSKVKVIQHLEGDRLSLRNLCWKATLHSYSNI